MIGLSAAAGRRAFAGILLVSAAALATACSPGGPQPTATVTVTRTASPPAATTPAATPAATQQPGAAAAQCPTAGLRVGVATQQGAAGTIYYNLNFTNISGTHCVLQGYPGVSLVTAGSNAGSQIGADAKRDAVTPVAAITLPPGRIAHAVLGVSQAGNYPASRCQPVTAHWLKVFPPDQYTAAYVKFTVRTCASTAVETLHITAISAGA